MRKESEDFVIIFLDRVVSQSVNYTLSSTTSYYQKLRNVTRGSFQDWSCMCGKG